MASIRSGQLSSWLARARVHRCIQLEPRMSFGPPQTPPGAESMLERFNNLEAEVNPCCIPERRRLWPVLPNNICAEYRLILVIDELPGDLFEFLASHRQFIPISRKTW